MKILFLLEKEMKAILHNKFIVCIILLFPPFVIIVGTLIATQEVRDIKVMFVDYDHSALSRMVIRQISASSYFTNAGISPNYDCASKAMYNEKVDMIMLIPRHFSRDRVLQRKNNIIVYANGVNNVKCKVGLGYVKAILSPRNGKTDNIVSCITMYNPRHNFKLEMLPALIAIIIMMICGFFIMITMMKEKESGTIDQLSIAPICTIQYLLSKLIPCWIIGAVTTVYCMLMSWLFYDVYPSNFLLAFSLSMLLVFFMCGVGAVVSTHSRTMYQAVFVIWFVIVCLFLIGGPFNYSERNNTWTVVTSICNPIQCYITAMQDMVSKDVDSIRYVAKYAISLAASALLVNVWIFAERKK